MYRTTTRNEKRVTRDLGEMLDYIRVTQQRGSYHNVTTRYPLIPHTGRLFRCSPIKIVAWSLRVDQRLFAVPFAISLVWLIATQLADIMYFSVRIFFSSIISIFFNKVRR